MPPTAPLKVVLPTVPLLSVSVRLFEAKSASTVPVMLIVAPAGLLPLLVESSVTLAPNPTLSLSVIALPAVVIPALSVIGVAPVPSRRLSRCPILRSARSP